MCIRDSLTREHRGHESLRVLTCVYGTRGVSRGRSVAGLLRGRRSDRAKHEEQEEDTIPSGRHGFTIVNRFKQRRRLRWGCYIINQRIAPPPRLSNWSPTAATAKPLTRREFQSRGCSPVLWW